VDTPVLTSRQADGILHLQLNRPEARNALSRALIAALADALRAASSDEAIRVVVLSGGERQFCAGADIKEFVAEGGAVLESPKRIEDWAAIERFPKPLVAAVEGYAFGGGFELVLTADIVVAAENARFAFPEINLGLFPGDGGTQRATRVAGKALVMKMIMTGEPIDAPTALAAGLVSELVAPGEVTARADELAGLLAAKPPVALRLAKAAVLAAYESPLSGGLVQERQLVARAFATEDRVEGVTAFKEKRPPQFRGR
jgi:enoyl-CoA hydratase